MSRGLPPIDRNSYARENGWMIDALCALHDAAGEAAPLAEAIASAQWVQTHLGRDGGGFSHGISPASNRGGPYLGDTVAMGQAFLSLYAATGDRRWLVRAQEATHFIDAHFRGRKGGLVTASDSNMLRALPDRDENVAVVRLANAVARYGGDGVSRELAARAMRWLASPGVARLMPTGAVLLADYEITHEPTHVTVVGAKNDPSAASLFRRARAAAPPYRRVEWLDLAEGVLPNSDVVFPTLGRAAAFTCSGSACSLPAFTPEQLMERLARTAAQLQATPRRSQPRISRGGSVGWSRPSVARRLGITVSTTGSR